MADFQLTERQTAVKRGLLASQAKHQLIYGGARSGKTFLIVWGMVQRAIKAPGARQVIIRRRFNQVKQSVWLDTYPAVMQAAFPSVQYEDKTQDGYSRLSNGSEIWFGGLDDKERVEKILGKEFCAIYLNECSQIPYEHIPLVRTRLAQKVKNEATGRDLALRFWYDLNPVGVSHWSSRLFISGVDPITKQPVDGSQYAYAHMNPLHNQENLPVDYIKDLEALPERARRRFLLGEYQPDDENALWTLETFEGLRVSTLPAIGRIVIGVDPSGASADTVDTDAIGIVVAGKLQNQEGYIVLADGTMKAHPRQWSEKVRQLYNRFSADCVIAESNYGGAMVEAVLKSHAPDMPVKMVHASRGKHVRAEPVATLYRAGLVLHTQGLDDLEDEYCGFMSYGYEGVASPNRADAAIWALTELAGIGAGKQLSTVSSGQGY